MVPLLKVCAPQLQCPLVLGQMAQLLGVEGPSYEMEDLIKELCKNESERLNYTQIAGEKLQNFESIYFEHESGLAVPQWFDDDARKEADHLLDLTIQFMAGVGKYHNPTWIQTRSGKMLSQLMKNMEETLDGNSTKKFIAYSTVSVYELLQVIHVFV
ncbi:unnamed protein product [Cylicostephanus goldi]|uniref:Uncharacterized protein n=1 Tax=Cylicostephanus goldi TaxID=71465 RepID=A0A3P6TJ07_CYLGO|nr:unnamed protein product [Cylicostephanus goldi]